VTQTAAPLTAPRAEIVLRHVEPGDDLAFARALETVEWLDAHPWDWELQSDSDWHHGEHRIFHSSDEIGIQPKHGSALVTVTFPKGAWQDAAHGTRHILQAMRIVSGRGDQDEQYVLADDWCLAAFSTLSESGHSPKSVAMATPWEPASSDPVGRRGHGKSVRRLLDACPSALRWEAHLDDGLPHVRIDRIEWTTWNQEDLSPNAMEILRAMSSIEARIAALAARTAA
jgi:hypothetical protein